jgi:hypothetical protein
MYTIFSAVLRQQRKSDVMMYLGSPLAAPSIMKQVPIDEFFREAKIGMTISIYNQDPHLKIWFSKTDF